METLIVTFAIAWTAIVSYGAFLTLHGRNLAWRLAGFRRPDAENSPQVDGLAA
jgi:hypothetical protein